MSRQPVVALAATLAVTLFLSASPGLRAETLRIGMQADPATLDPAQSASFVDRVALAAVCDKLIDLDAKRLSRNVWRGWMAGARCDSGRLSKPVWTASCGPRPPVGGIAASTCVTQAM